MVEQLGLDSTFFLMMAVFFGFFLINYFISLKPLSNTLIERDKRMAGREKEIKNIQAELQTIKVELNQQIKIAQGEASKRFSDLKSSAVEKQRNLLNEARNNSAKQIGSLRDDLQKQLGVEEQKLGGEIDAFVQLIIERISVSSAPGISSKTAPRTEA
ncbi:hypothetical protein GW915_02155 [bacterium]|nr:hypothetical protein [bacterium]